MKNKNLELLVKLNEKYGLNDKAVELKNQLKKTVAEKRILEQKLHLKNTKKVFFLKRWYRFIIDSIKELFRRKEKFFKTLRQFYASQYKYAFEQYELGLLDEGDLQVLIKNEHNATYRIKEIQKQLDLKQKQEIYLTIVKNDRSRLIEFLETANSDLIILNEELRRTKKLEFYTSEDLKKKNNKINRLKGRITKVEKEIEYIKEGLYLEKQKEKRPVGRPKGSAKKGL